MFQADWLELIAQVEEHGSDRVVFILEDEKTGEVITFDGQNVKFDNREGMITVELSAI